MAVQPADRDAGWRAAALMIQRMPPGPRSPILTSEEAAELWNRATILMRTATASELTDGRLSAEDLLHRLFHADGLLVQDPRAVRARCRCSEDRVAGTLRSFPRDDLEQMQDDAGQVVVVCEFCKSRYVFSEADLDRLYAS